MLGEIEYQLDKMINEEEWLSLIVMILHKYFTKYPKRDLNNTMNLIKKGYRKYLEFLEESD